MQLVFNVYLFLIESKTKPWLRNWLFCSAATHTEWIYCTDERISWLLVCRSQGKGLSAMEICSVVLLSEHLPLNYSCPAWHEQESRDLRRQFSAGSPYSLRLGRVFYTQATAWFILNRAQLLLCLKTSKLPQTFFFFFKENKPYISLSYCCPPDVSILFTKRCSPDLSFSTIWGGKWKWVCGRIILHYAEGGGRQMDHALCKQRKKAFFVELFTVGCQIYMSREDAGGVVNRKEK